MEIYYLPTHEYIKVDGDTGYVGVSDYAARALGAVTYVDMPEEGDEVEAGAEFGAIESRKAASDLYSPVTGVVLAINEELTDDPKLINNAPLDAWIIKVSISDATELDNLMDQQAYDAYIAKL